MILTAKSDFKKWKNQESIAEIAFNEAKEGTDFSEESGVDDEWFERFMDAAKFVSSKVMQLIWGKILAGEFEKPGSTPPSMIRILSEMTSELAQAFQKICSMKVEIRKIDLNGYAGVWNTSIIVPVYNNLPKIKKVDISKLILNELDTLGVIKFREKDFYLSSEYTQLVLCLEHRIDVIEFDKVNAFPSGRIQLTDAGITLSKVLNQLK